MEWTKAVPRTTPSPLTFILVYFLQWQRLPAWRPETQQSPHRPLRRVNSSPCVSSQMKGCESKNPLCGHTMNLVWTWRDARHIESSQDHCSRLLTENSEEEGNEIWPTQQISCKQTHVEEMQGERRWTEAKPQWLSFDLSLGLQMPAPCLCAPTSSNCLNPAFCNKVLPTVQFTLTALPWLSRIH